MTKLFISNKDESIRMFENNFLEAFSKVHWSVPLYIFVPTILYLFYNSILLDYNLDSLSFLAILGIFAWTLTEYSLHRWLFHFHPKNKSIEKIFWTFHGVHHDYPRDSKRLVMPPSVSVPLAILFFFMFKSIIGNTAIYPFFMGFLIGYLFYDITHYAIHHFNFKGNIWKKLKDWHTLHHYKYDYLGFGVSSPLWDYIFKTTYPNKEQNVQLKENENY